MTSWTGSHPSMPSTADASATCAGVAGLDDLTHARVVQLFDGPGCHRGSRFSHALLGSTIWALAGARLVAGRRDSGGQGVGCRAELLVGAGRRDSEGVEEELAVDLTSDPPGAPVVAAPTPNAERFLLNADRSAYLGNAGTTPTTTMPTPDRGALSVRVAIRRVGVVRTGVACIWAISSSISGMKCASGGMITAPAAATWATAWASAWARA